MPVSQSLSKSTPKSYANILNRVMVIYRYVSLRCDRKIDMGMISKKFQHVIEKTNASFNGI